MFDVVKNLHSYWAYVVLTVLVVTVINALIKVMGKKEYQAKDFRLALFTLITFHIQLLIGIITFLSADYFSRIEEIGGVGELMNNTALRSQIIEHPLTLLIAVVLVTIGYSKHKKKRLSQKKFSTILLFYGIALALVLIKIPWKTWLNISS